MPPMIHRTEPASQGILVVPSDSADLNTTGKPTRSIWVGGAGNVKVTFNSGDTVLISGITAGTILPFAVKRIWSTTTTATLIVALY